jgi:hypothetical protein
MLVTRTGDMFVVIIMTVIQQYGRSRSEHVSY